MFLAASSSYQDKTSWKVSDLVNLFQLNPIKQN